MTNKVQIPFGSYTLVKRIAVGGMAEVFLATHQDRHDDELLVVKCILPELQSRPDVVQMFLDEVRLSSLLHHKNTVRVHDFGMEDGVHFIAMEHVDGISLYRLQRRLGTRKVPMPLACWLVAEVCAGLAHAHSRKLIYSGQSLSIVHRDVSPPNILLSRRSEVKLADFGVAKATMRLTKTSPGQIKGKYAYMSPEQARNKPLDHRSDIFSIGLVLYELTTGERVFPFAGPESILRALISGRYTPPEELVKGYPAALASIVNQALQWRPEDRYQDAGQIRDALTALIPREADPVQGLRALVAAACERQQLSEYSSERSSAPDSIPMAPISEDPSEMGRAALGDTTISGGFISSPAMAAIGQQAGAWLLEVAPEPAYDAAPASSPTSSQRSPGAPTDAAEQEQEQEQEPKQEPKQEQEPGQEQNPEQEPATIRSQELPVFISHDAERAEAAAEEPVALEGTNGVWEGNRQASLFNLMADEAPPPSIAREPEERITTNLPPSTRSRRRGSGRAWMLVLLAATLAAALVCAVLYFGD